MGRIKLLAIGLTLCLLGGCAHSMEEIRAEQPSQVLESNKPPNELSECVLFNTQEKVTQYQGFTEPVLFTKSEHPKGTYQITALVYGRAVGEALFKTNGNGGSTVELRTQWNFWSKDDFWTCIKHCALTP